MKKILWLVFLASFTSFASGDIERTKVNFKVTGSLVHNTGIQYEIVGGPIMDEALGILIEGLNNSLSVMLCSLKSEDKSILTVSAYIRLLDRRLNTCNININIENAQGDILTSRSSSSKSIFGYDCDMEVIYDLIDEINNGLLSD